MSEESGACPPDSGASQNQNLEEICICDWTRDEVRSWLLKSNFPEIMDRFAKYSGPDIVQLSKSNISELSIETSEVNRLFNRITTLLKYQKKKSLFKENDKYDFIMETRGTPEQSAGKRDTWYRVHGSLASETKRPRGLRRKFFDWATENGAYYRADDANHGIVYSFTDPGITCLLQFDLYFMTEANAVKALKDIYLPKLPSGRVEFSEPFGFYSVWSPKMPRRESINLTNDSLKAISVAEDYTKHEDSEEAKSVTTSSSSWEGKNYTNKHVCKYQNVTPNAFERTVQVAHLIDKVFVNKKRRLGTKAIQRSPRNDDDDVDLLGIEDLRPILEKKFEEERKKFEGNIKWKHLEFLDRDPNNFIAIGGGLHICFDSDASIDIVADKIGSMTSVTDSAGTVKCTEVVVKVIVKAENEKLMEALVNASGAATREPDFVRVHMYVHDPQLFAACLSIKAKTNEQRRQVISGNTGFKSST